MIDALVTVVLGCSLAMGAWALLLTTRDRPTGVSTLVGMSTVELALLVQAGWAVVALTSGERPSDVATFAGYLFASLVILPAGVLWARADRTRSGTAVLGVACLAVAVVTIRLHQVWAA